MPSRAGSLAARDPHPRGRRPAELALARARRHVDLVQTRLQPPPQRPAVEGEAVEPRVARHAVALPDRLALDPALAHPEDRDLHDLRALRQGPPQGQAPGPGPPPPRGG